MDTPRTIAAPSRGYQLIGWLIAAVWLGTLAPLLGRSLWLCELASHFRLQCALGGIVCLVAAAVIRRSSLILPAMLAAGLNAAYLLPSYVGTVAAQPNSLVLRAVQFNVSRINPTPDRAFEYLQSVKPDIVVLEECDQRWIERLQQARTDYPSVIGQPREDAFGIALASRIPLDEASIRRLGPYRLPAVIARVHVGERPLTVIGVHAMSPLSPRDSAVRNTMLRELAALVRAETRPVLLLGDLNTSPWSWAFGELIRASGLQDTRRGFGVQASWPAGLGPLGIPIDHCLVSPGLVVHHRLVGPSHGSDHHPILVELAVE